MKRLALFAAGIVVGLGLSLALPRLGDRPADRIVGAAATADIDATSSVAVDGDDDDADAAARAAAGAVRLSADARALAAIETVTATPVEYRPEDRATGTVIDTAPLQDAQREAAAAGAAAEAQATTLATIEDRLGRLRELARGGQIGVTRDIAELELAARRERERAVVLAARAERLTAALRTQWGAALADATAPGSELAAALEAGRAVVVQFAVPAAPDVATVAVSHSGDRGAAVAGTILGPALAALPGSLGETWLATVTTRQLRRGSAVAVWVPRGRESGRGLLLPATAIVWRGGSRWYYVARGAGRFERRSAATAVARPQGYVLPGADAAEEAVVSRGAQVLLAEEFRGAIPDEDDD